MTKPSSAHSPILISVAVHGAILTALVWLSVGRKAPPPDDVGPPRGVVRGPGILKLTVPLGPSISPEQAAPYLGRYIMLAAGRPDAELRVTRVYDGDDHWSLSITEGDAASYFIVPVAPDSFVSRLNREHQVVFVRGEGASMSIEISWGGSVRRGGRQD